MLDLLDFAENEEELLRETEHAWKDFEDRYRVGQDVEGQVTVKKIYGVFVDFGEPFPALIEVTSFAKSRYPIDRNRLPEIGCPIRCEIIQIVPARRVVRAIERLSDK